MNARDKVLQTLQKKSLTPRDIKFLESQNYPVTVYPRRKEVVVSGFKRYSFKG